MRRQDALIGGDWNDAPRMIEVENPATEGVVGAAAACGAAMVDSAVAAARAAATKWGETSPAERAALVEALTDRLEARRDELVQLIVAEVGAPLRIAREWHVDAALDLFRRAAANGRSYRYEEECGNSHLLRRPAGVVGCITPWNYPLYQVAAKVGPALAAGCTVILKPAELAPLTAYVVAEAAIEAGLPAGVFNLVPGLGHEVGAALAGHAGLDVVSFTGSTAVGRQIAAQAGAQLTRVCLELGGKSASIVCADADLETAVRATVDSAMLNSGQSCSALTRLFVPADRLAAAADVAGDRAEELVVGDPTLETTDLGPLISAQQRTRVVTMVGGALDRGAQLVAGEIEASWPTGHYVSPIVLSDLSPDDPISQQEVFGPVLVLHAYHSEDEAVRLANDTSYGLSGAVWAASDQRAMALGRRLHTGQVDLNGAPFNPEAPFGGWKDSGIGRELGVAGFEEYTELTAVQR